MENAFFRMPMTLSPEDIPVLEEMSAENCDGGGNPYEELIKAIRKHGDTKVWYKY
jgi:hypothetical protein